MMTNKVLVVDDDSQFREFITSLLDSEFRIRNASNLQEGLACLGEENFDLCLIDYRLPDGTGHDLVREMRRKNIDTPVFLLTGYADKNVAINSIELGISCLLEKPFEQERLHSSIRRVLKKADGAGDIRLDEHQRCIFCGDERVALTGIEFRILEILIRNKNRQVSREDLQREIWGQSLISKHTLDTHIYNLKKKSTKLKKAVRVVHGTGFIFDTN